MAALIVTGILGALPLAGVIVASDQPAPGFNVNPGPAVIIYLLAILALFGLPAALVLDRRPVAGLLLALIGGGCVMLTFWHTPFIAVPAFAATSAAVVAAIHMAHRSPG